MLLGQLPGLPGCAYIEKDAEFVLVLYASVAVPKPLLPPWGYTLSNKNLLLYASVGAELKSLGDRQDGAALSRNERSIFKGGHEP